MLPTPNLDRTELVKSENPEPFDPKSVRAAYDVAADDYVAAFADDLDGLPVDRSVLDVSAELLGRKHPVLDIGCGPGQVAQYLTDRGVEMVGMDLAPRMLVLAAQRAQRHRFVNGDTRALPFHSKSFSGAVAFYSIQHLPRWSLAEALSEIHRVLVPEGVLVVATHLGHGEVYVDEFLGHEIAPVGGTLYTEEELRHELERRSFRVEQTRRRGPLPHEHPSERIYLTARREDDECRRGAGLARY
jgi:ubiquinone/menaquinone biosynthesis C-methylase UbiE